MAEIAATAEHVSSGDTDKNVPADMTGSQQTDNQDGDNKFQKAIAAWRSQLSLFLFFLFMKLLLTSNTAINLTTLVPSLDTTASEIVAHQRDSLVQRKDLAQKTKDFRKLDDSTKLSEIKGLLKGTPLLVQ